MISRSAGLIPRNVLQFTDCTGREIVVWDEYHIPGGVPFPYRTGPFPAPFSRPNFHRAYPWLFKLSVAINRANARPHKPHAGALDCSKTGRYQRLDGGADSRWWLAALLKGLMARVPIGAGAQVNPNQTAAPASPRQRTRDLGRPRGLSTSGICDMCLGPSPGRRRLPAQYLLYRV